MAKILATEIRVGNLLEWDKRLWRVLKCYHVHVGGRGGAYMQINFHNNRPIGILLPTSVVLEVVETEPGIRNATATNSFKPAKMETGITVQVPAFVSAGEKIRVSTDSGSYLERA